MCISGIEYGIGYKNQKNTKRGVKQRVNDKRTQVTRR